MHNQLLERFNLDVHTKQAVLDYITEYLYQKIIDEALLGKSVEHLASAVKELINAFDELNDIKQTFTRERTAVSSK